MTRLHRFLAGRKDAAAPIEAGISNICEAFGVLPSAALREWRRYPELVQRVLEYRAYKCWFTFLRTNKDENAWPAEGAEPMFDLVCTVEAEQLRAAKARIAAQG